MTTCDTSGCGRNRMAGKKFCNIHDPLAKTNVKQNAKIARAANEKAELDKIESDRLAKISVASARQTAADERARAEQVKINNQATANMAVILNLAQIVRALRINNRGQIINAGNNAGLPITVGGTDNPYMVVSLPASPAAEPRAIRKQLQDSGKLENSDSGLLKYRSPDNIFIHVY